jgi:hypothetical protein
MLTKPASPALRALYGFSNRVGWDEISKFLDGELVAVYEQLAMARDEVTIHQLQGRAQFITEFQKMVREAPQELEKRRESTL